MAKEQDLLSHARSVIASGEIAVGEPDVIRRAAIALRRNGGNLELEDQRIVNAAIAMFGRDFDREPPPPTPFDEKIEQCRSEIAEKLMQYEEAQETLWQFCLELGGNQSLVGGRLTVATGQPRRRLPADEERRLLRLCEVAAADELRLREQVEEACALLRERIQILQAAARQWREEQERKGK